MTELQRLARRLADDYQFECQGGPLRNCMEWRALCAAIDTLAVNPPPSGASPQAEELRAANVANLREMVGMAGRHREALLAVRECILALSPGHRTGYDWNADPLFLTLKEGRALNLIDDALKAAPASPQAETSANVRALTVHICDDCLNLRGEMCNEPGCRFCRRTMAEVAEHLDALLIRPRIDGVSVLVDEGAPLPAPVSPVEPEPPTNPACARCGHALSAHRPDFGACDGRDRPCACPEYQVPTVEPEPCVWRADWREGRDGSILVPSCQPEMEIDAAFVQECVKLHGWKFCTHCGAPLKVEKP